MNGDDLIAAALTVFAWECLRTGFRELRVLVLRQEAGEMIEECPRCGRTVPNLVEHLQRCRPAGHGGVYSLGDIRRSR